MNSKVNLPLNPSADWKSVKEAICISNQYNYARTFGNHGNMHALQHVQGFPLIKSQVITDKTEAFVSYSM